MGAKIIIMKKLIILFHLLFFGNALFGQNQSLLDSVTRKLNSDNRSFENFIVLGKFHFYDALLHNTDLTYQFYVGLYNAFDPLCRLIDFDSLNSHIAKTCKMQFQNTQMILKRNQNKESSHYKSTLVLEKFWNNRKAIKKIYTELVSNPNYFRKDLEAEDFENYLRKYLYSYYIEIDSNK